MQYFYVQKILSPKFVSTYLIRARLNKRHVEYMADALKIIEHKNMQISYTVIMPSSMSLRFIATTAREGVHTSTACSIGQTPSPFLLTI